MGVDTYISRGQLPGAAVTRRLLVARSAPLSPVPVSAELSQSHVSKDSSTATAFREAAMTVKAQLGAPQSQASPGTPTIPAFSIVTVMVGGFLWVEELGGSSVSREQVQLICAMSKALALDEGEPQVGQFDWPIHSNAQLDLGEGAARASLCGFLQRKIDGGKCQGLVLLGGACQQKLDLKQLDLGRCVHTLSTGEMLADAKLKKQAWLDLQPINHRL
jgi:hypothetical protein